MKNILISLGLAAVVGFSASGVEIKKQSFFRGDTTNIALYAWCGSPQFGGTGTTTTWTTTATNGIVFYTADGTMRWPLSATNVSWIPVSTNAVYTNATAGWNWTTVNTNVLNGFPWAFPKIGTLTDGNVSPSTIYVTVVGTNAAMNSVLGVTVYPTMDGVTYDSTHSFAFTVTATGVTPVTIITNVPSWMQCFKAFIPVVTLTTNTTTAGWLQVQQFGLCQAAP